MSGEIRRGGAFPTARHLSSYARYGEIPSSTRAEFAVIGRSNVGKSSFINHVFADKGLARVSSTPGKTRLANFFACSDGTLWVDLPGYGYARAGGGEKGRWARLIGDYCERRGNLAGIVWLLDARHPGMEHDLEADEWLRGLGRPVLPVATKCDKLTHAEVVSNGRRFMEIFRFREAPVMYSIRDAGSRERFWTTYERWKVACGL
jgi:GTP-binding protein